MHSKTSKFHRIRNVFSTSENATNLHTLIFQKKYLLNFKSSGFSFLREATGNLKNIFDYKKNKEISISNFQNLSIINTEFRSLLIWKNAEMLQNAIGRPETGRYGRERAPTKSQNRSTLPMPCLASQTAHATCCMLYESSERAIGIHKMAGRSRLLLNTYSSGPRCKVLRNYMFKPRRTPPIIPCFTTQRSVSCFSGFSCNNCFTTDTLERLARPDYDIDPWGYIQADQRVNHRDTPSKRVRDGLMPTCSG
jgi:hypothetical protein